MLLNTPWYLRDDRQSGGGYTPFSLLSPEPDEMDRAVNRAEKTRFSDREFDLDGGFDTDPQKGDPSVVNTSLEAGLLDTPMGQLSVEDMVAAGMNMGSLPVGSLAMGVEGLMSQHLGPYGVVGGPISPNVGTNDFYAQTPALDHTLGIGYDLGAQAANASSNRGAFGNPDITPQAQFGNRPAPTPPNFMSVPSFDPFGLMEEEDTFGGVMGNVEGGGRGYGGPGRDASGDGMGGYGGPEGVGRDNDRGGGIGF